MPTAYGAGYGYVLTALRAYAYAAVLCARATPLRAYARPFLRPQRGHQSPSPYTYARNAGVNPPSPYFSHLP